MCKCNIPLSFKFLTTDLSQEIQGYYNMVTFVGVCMTYKTGFNLDYWIYCTRDYRQLQRYRYSLRFMFTVTHTHTHTLGLSIFNNRSLATDFISVSSNHT
jgi:hypothetical protein